MKKKKSRNWADLVREVGMYVSPSPREGDALARLAALEPFAPLHQPHNLAGIRAAISASSLLSAVAI